MAMFLAARASSMTHTSVARPHLSAVPALVEVGWLAAQPDASLAQPNAGEPAAIRVVDLRWAPGVDMQERYRAGHLPRAVRVDLDHDLAQHGGGGPGRHPFPPPERFAELLGRMGIGAQTHVVAYDDGPGAYAARLWFMLRVHGHERASVLEGGLVAWRAAGLPLSTADEPVTPVAPPALQLDRGRLLDRGQVKELLRRRAAGGESAALLLDARARPRYRGEVEPLDKRKGHIPGAVNAPFEENLRSAADPRFRPPEELRALYEKLGAASASEVVVSCGSGVTACHDALALELAGLGLPKLYVGSFSEWSALPDEPVATGSEPGKL
jgi:thiosulfate/3-mercaptopyruvate sulfurtransferase